MNKYMEIANNLARDNLTTKVGGPFGACVVKDGTIVGKGSNHVLESNDPTAHAEIMAIRDACKNFETYDLSNCELYTSCYPCPMCMSAIMWANIDKIYYGCNVIDTEGIGFRDAKFYEMQREDKMKEFVKEIDREECLKLYSNYKELNPTIY